MQKDKLNSAILVYQGIKGLHKRNKSVSSAYGLEIDMLSSAILGQIKGNPGICSKEIGRIFDLTATQTSRVIDKLKKEKLIKFIKNIKDKRSFELYLDLKGQKVYQQILSRAILSFENAFNRLENSEKNLFKPLFRKFLESLGEVNTVKLDKDPALMQEIRQLTRTLGLLGNNLFGLKGVDPIYWHILSLLEEQHTVSAKIVSATFGLKLATSYSILNRLKKDNLVKVFDKKVKKLVLTSQGKYYLNKVSTAGIKIIEQGIRNFNVQDKKLFAQLWLKYSGEHELSNERVLGQQINLTRIFNAPERFEFRKFIIEQRVQQNLIRLLPAQLGSNDAQLMVIRNKNKIIVACEAIIKNKQLEIVHFLCAQDFNLTKSLLWITLEELLNTIDSTNIAIRITNCSESVWNLLPIDNGSIKIISRKSIKSFRR